MQEEPAHKTEAGPWDSAADAILEECRSDLACCDTSSTAMCRNGPPCDIGEFCSRSAACPSHKRVRFDCFPDPSRQSSRLVSCGD